MVAEHYQFKATFTKTQIFGYAAWQILRTQVTRVTPLSNIK
jgi:hypothetical protein